MAGGFFSKLTGGSSDDYYDEYPENQDLEQDFEFEDTETTQSTLIADIDLYEDSDNLYLRTFIAGINPKEIDIDATRDSVSISAERYDSDEVAGDSFLQKELKWGAIRREIELPKEIDIENISANIKHGVLTLTLPKIDKDRKIKVKI